MSPNNPRIKGLTLQANMLVDEHKRKKWLERLKHCNIRATIESLSNRGKMFDRTSVSYNDVEVTYDTKS